MDPTKRKAGPELVSNPFIKKRNLEWRISPPPLRNPHRQLKVGAGNIDEKPDEGKGAGIGPPLPADVNSNSAAIEAGDVKITDHAAHFSQLLSECIFSPYPEDTPRLSVAGYRALYERNFGSPHGAHFVIHQHDHPVAGTHYDIRLQINPTSSASWACMYGVPGDANSTRPLRNATETRVHCLWNHLIETASTATGSLLIWDTGTYAVLERRSKHAPAVDPESQETDGGGGTGWGKLTEQEKLARAFADRKIRLRLDGARLPRPYVLNLRLTKDEDAAGRSKAQRSAQGMPRRRRPRTPLSETSKTMGVTSSSSGSSDEEGANDMEGEEKYKDGSGTPAGNDEAELSAMERELRELEDAEVRRTNAYPGASNTIGSVHQRKWFLSMDREASGFVKTRKGNRVVWEKKIGEYTLKPRDNIVDGNGSESSGRISYPFYVRGPEFERSVITGRLGNDILSDEGVTRFVNRKGWRPVVN